MVKPVDIINNQLLVRNTLWNLFGQIVPIAVAVFAIPLLINGLGIDRFGVLTLTWAVIGYFSIFDFGLGRALTKLVAENIGTGQKEKIPVLVWTALFMMTIFSLFGALLLGILAPWLVTVALKIPLSLRTETIYSIYLMALSLPFVITTTGLNGILEAHQQFRVINFIRIPMGLFNYLAPVVVLLTLSHTLIPIVAVLVVGRGIAWLAYFLICLRLFANLTENIKIDLKYARSLFSFGGWMTISNIIAPLMLYLDRFLLGSMVSIAAVAYYTTPYEVITKLWIIPTSFMGVMFPAFSTTFVQNKKHLNHLYWRCMKYIFLCVFPIVVVVIIFAKKGLSIWLGAEFAANSFHAMQLLAIGVLIHSMAQTSFALIQATGRPDITAKLHMLELPLYLSYLWLLIRQYGIEGAASAWVLRVTISFIALTFLANRFLNAKQLD